MMQKKLIYILTGIIIGGVSMLCYDKFINKDNQSNNVLKIPFDGLMVIPYNDDILNNFMQEHNDLYIEFHEEKFLIKKGEAFDYGGAIKSKNGMIGDIPSKSFDDLEKGKYLVQYVVVDENNSKKRKEYVKLLIVY